jgi:NAD(P)-dependent dehydrogenase (short-subunit alcohol dehydrogenase family)
MEFTRYKSAHVDPQGPGDARPAALAIIEDEHRQGDLKGKTVVVTGCSSGIGIETARALLTTGANLILTVRDQEKGENVIKSLDKDMSPVQSVDLVSMDLNSLDSVRRGAEDILLKTDQISVLILNAGIGGVVQGTTDDGFESHFGVNHLAHFLLFQLLRPALFKASTPSFHTRVVVLSSLIHRLAPLNAPDYNFRTTPYSSAMAYASSKAANIHFANQVERLYGPQGVHAISLHPGAIKTGLQRYHSPEYSALVDQFMVGEQGEKMLRTFKSVEQGAATTVLAAVGRSFEGMGGLYLEDCGVAEVLKGEAARDMYQPGAADFAFDAAVDKQLWADSAKMVGVDVD